MKHFVTPVELEVKLFAAEPQIRRPICMNWDERGRLWIAETVDYPNNRQPAGEGHDRIVICEDTDGDGVADKFTVFADKLSIPTSFTFYKGGIIVHAGAAHALPQDTDGDDNGRRAQGPVHRLGHRRHPRRAEQSALRASTTGFTASSATPASTAPSAASGLSFSQGFFRFQPGRLQARIPAQHQQQLLGRRLQRGGPAVRLHRQRQPQRLHADPQSLLRTGPRLVVARARRHRRQAPIHPITDKVRQVDWHGHFTAAAGHALYTARLYPNEYWNRAAFVAEPTGHLVATFQLQRKGSDFRLTQCVEPARQR